MGSGGRQVGGLVDAQLAHRADALGVVHERRAVLDDGVHDRPPTDAQLSRHLGHGAGLLTHLPTRLGPGPAGEHRLGVDVEGALGPGLGLAVSLDAAPPALDPTQSCGTAEAGEVPDVDRLAVLRLGPRSARSAADDIGCRLDGDDELVAALAHVQHPEPVQSQKRFGQTGTVAHCQGSPVLVAVRQRRRWRDP
jgi:hypothetical protein